MRLLLVGDLHYEMRQLDWVLSAADGFDLVVIAGDLLDISSTVGLDAQVPVVLGYLERLAARTTAIVCSGNHDLTRRDANGEKAAVWLADADAFGVHTDFASVPVGDGDARISVSPWWEGPKGRAKVEQFLADEGAKAAHPWIWVYHWPPPDVPVSWTGRQSYGDADVAGWIDRFGPDLMLSGHVHQSPWAKGGSWIARRGTTWILNAGREIGDVPSHAVVDLDAWTATFSSTEGVEQQSLAEPTPAAVGP